MGRLESLSPRIAAWFSLFWFYIRSSKFFMLTLTAAGVVFVAVIFFAWGYYYSQHRFDGLMAGFEQMSERYNLPYEGMSWATRFSALQRRTEVADRAVEEIKQYLYEKDQRVRELEEHLYFYRTVIAPEDESKDLTIFSVSLQRAADARRYPIEVVLRNHRSKKGAVKGRVRVLVEGEAEPQGTTLVRDDLFEKEVKFSFKYFQRLKGVLHLPERFSPNRLTIVVDSNKFEDIEETYAWTALLDAGE